jgi:hypothetical protein
MIAVAVLAVVAAAIAWIAAEELPESATARVGLAVGAMLLAVEPLHSAIAHNRVAGRTDTRVLASQWIAEHVPPGQNVQVIGKALAFYGMLLLPPGVTSRRAKPEPAALAAEGVTHVIVYDHVLSYLRPDAAAMRALGPHLRLVAEFDPFTRDRESAVFETSDAYYVPFHGFRGVSRPGPIVRIYALDAGGAAPGGEPHG